MAAYNLVLIEVTHPRSDQAAQLYIVCHFTFESVIIRPNILICLIVALFGRQQNSKLSNYG